LFRAVAQISAGFFYSVRRVAKYPRDFSTPLRAFAEYPRDFSTPPGAFARFTNVFFMFRKAEGSFSALFRSNGRRRSFFHRVCFEMLLKYEKYDIVF
jgi:hypothetical protein